MARPFGFWFLWGFLLIAVTWTVGAAKSPSKSTSATKTSRSSSSSSSTSSSSSSSSSSNVLQLTETEMWDGTDWKAASPTSRWTLGSADGPSTKSPDRQSPPSGTKFQGDWKIVTSSKTTRDAYGWEYTIAQPYPTRRRTWLRSLVDLDPALLAKEQQIRKKRPQPQWMRALRDEFNFKGFGVSLFKSLVFPQSCGISLRLPLTFNLNAWERHPALPSVSSSLNFFAPESSIAFILSTSMRVEWLQWATARTLYLLQYWAVWLVWTLLKGIFLASSALAYPITRQFYAPLPPLGPYQTARDHPCKYPRTKEERIGTSWQWRWCQHRGYEFRVSYWHYYAPTVVGLLESLQQRRKRKNSNAAAAFVIPAWLARHSAACGLSTSGPIPDSDPFIACSAVWSFSGFYWKPTSSSVLATERLAVAATTAAASTNSTTTATINKKLDSSMSSSVKRKVAKKESSDSSSSATKKKTAVV